MGVHGLWRLIEPSGRPVRPETLENRILAVDVSIWLHHFIKGFQDSKGASVANAHLLGIYHRVCKLLFYKIKPVFVFDGGVPVLKKNTIAKRNQQKQNNRSAADRIHKTLLSALAKHGAISKVLSEKAQAAIESTSPKKSRTADNEDDLFVLPPSQLDSTVSSGSEDEEDQKNRYLDLHSIDTESIEFKRLPVDVRHDILTDLKETRKQSSWGRIHELPTESNDFSSYQMKRLLKRQSVQVALEEVEKEMGGHSLSLGELEKLLKDEGVITTLKGNRIASDENTRYLLIKDIKQALLEAKKNDLKDIIEEKDEDVIPEVTSQTEKNKGEKEFENDLKKAIALSLENVPSTSREESSASYDDRRDKLLSSFLTDLEESDGEEETIITKLTPAQNYMMEYSGLTAHAINKIISSKRSVKKGLKTNENNQVTESSNGRHIAFQSDGAEPEKQTTIDDSSNEIVSSSVEIMSDSESSCDDLVEVNDGMEVIIKPEEAIEDDLFKDVFTHAEPKVVNKLDEKVEQPQESVPINQNEISKSKDIPKQLEQVSSSQKVEVAPSSSTNDKIKEQIEDIMKTYAKSEDSPQISIQGLKEAAKNIRKEEKELKAAKFTKERLASNITDQMCQETQELLELFGVPYIIAPMEAEAQCAFLDLANLTDGSITEDSDIWLFGGRKVYKNFFDQDKLVMEYTCEDIQNHYKLSREQMILLAMLVGSDYTTGLTGVGPVTALEILAAFPPTSELVSGLADFKTWFSNGKLPGPGKTALRGKLNNVVFNDNFPNFQIVEAYLEPTVDTNREKFSWAKPDVSRLIEFAKRKFGWNSTKSEAILQPVLKRLEDGNRIQKPITDYFKFERKSCENGRELMMSKRVKSAVEKIAKGPVNEESDNKEKEIKTKGRKKKAVGEKDSTKIKKKKVNKIKEVDEEIKILKETEEASKKKVKEIEDEIQKKISEKKNKEIAVKKVLHKKEVIPQKQKDKADMLKNKLKAIETFRKSKQGPGYVQKKGKMVKEPHEDAGYLSEDSSD